MTVAKRAGVWGVGVVLVMASGLFSAAQAVAQQRPGSIEIGVGGGRFFGGGMALGTNRFFNQPVEVDDDKLKAFWLGVELDKQWGIEVAVRRTNTHLIERGNGEYSSQPQVAGFDFATIEAMVTRSFPRGSFVPYLGAGAGVANLDIDVADKTIRDNNRFALALGGGAKFFANPWLGFRFDVRARFVYLGTRYGSNDKGWSDRGRWLTTQEVTLAVFGRFGHL